MASGDDIRCIDAVKAGKVNAYSELVERYQDFVYSLVLRMVKNPMDAEEIAQDVFVRAFRKLGSFRKEAKFATWIYRIAYNETVSFLRKRRMELTALDESGMENVPEEEVQEELMGLDAAEQKRLVDLALEKLGPTDAAIIDLFYLKGNTVDEIVGITHMSESNVKVKLHRLRKRLYTEMSRLLQERSTLMR